MPREPGDRDDASIEDIVDSCRLILAFTEDYNWEKFSTDPKTQSSVIHRLLIIGEAAKRLSPQVHDNHSSVPWKEIAGMRDRLIHGYHEVDLQEVWDTVQRDIPWLLRELTRS